MLLLPSGCQIFGGFEEGKLNGKSLVCFANGNRLLASWRTNQLKGTAFFFDVRASTWTMCEYRTGMLTRILESETIDSPTAPCIPATDIPFPTFSEFSRRDSSFFDLEGAFMKFTHDSIPFAVT